jgi:pyruvate,water dikinase
MCRSRLPLRVARALVAPKAASDEITRLRRAIELTGQVAPSAGPRERLAVAEHLLTVWPPILLPRAGSLLISGLGSFALAKRLLGDQATDDEFDAVRRALPHNPTTEMNLRLWSLSRAVRRDSASHAALQLQSPTALAEAFAARTLPPVLQRGLAAFLAQYGHRAIAEIDLGVPRWSENPTPLLGNLANYQTIEDGPQSPEAQFRSAAAEADRTVMCWSGVLPCAARGERGSCGSAGRARAVAGFAKCPARSCCCWRGRAHCRPAGRDLVQSGRVDAPDDVCFLTFEIHEAPGADVREKAAQRRAHYAEEPRRSMCRGCCCRTHQAVPGRRRRGRCRRSVAHTASATRHRAGAGHLEGRSRARRHPSHRRPIRG